jgi:hypothetical protein
MVFARVRDGATKRDEAPSADSPAWGRKPEHVFAAGALLRLGLQLLHYHVAPSVADMIDSNDAKDWLGSLRT